MQAIYLLCSSTKGISAHQLHRMLGITYKSAWFMAHRLRYAMTQTPLVEKLGGIVEADETYIGGKVRHRNLVKGEPYKVNRPGGHTDNKIAVVALVERGGRVRALPMEVVLSAPDLKPQKAEFSTCSQTFLATLPSWAGAQRKVW
jgi:hypothetical protein